MKNLDYPKDRLKFTFLVNDSRDKSINILKKFKADNEQDYIAIDIHEINIGSVVDARNGATRDKIYRSLAEVRNQLISRVSDTDYFFSVDSDILVGKGSLRLLVESQKDIVAGVVRNDYLVNSQAKYPWVRTNLLIKNKDGKLTHYLGYPLNSLFQVDVTGAIYLMTRDVYENIRYGYHEQGEDIYFCYEAASRGYEIWANTNVTPEHVMAVYQDICVDCDKKCKEYRVKDNKIKPVLKWCPKK